MEEKIDILIDQIDRHFNPSELEDLCYRLGLTIDHLEGGTKPAKIRELIGYLDRRGELSRLNEQLGLKRPNVLWSGLDVAQPTLNVPIVVAAMTRDEAEELAQSADPHVNGVLEGLGLIWQQYAASYLPNWLEYYSTRQQWRPLFGGGQTIEDIVWDVAEMLHERRANAMTAIYPRFRTEEFFAPDRQTRARLNDELSDTGVLFIIDPISLYHETVAERLLQSNLPGNTRAAFLIASPFNLRAITLHTVIETRIEIKLESLYARFHDNLDDLCEYGVSDVLTLQRWLYSRFNNAERHFRNPPLPAGKRGGLLRLMGQDPATQPSGAWPHAGGRP